MNMNDWNNPNNLVFVVVGIGLSVSFGYFFGIGLKMAGL